MKKREVFAILAAGAAVAVAAQALYRWLSGESEYEYDEDYDCDCADEYDEQEEEEEDAALDELLNVTYDEGFADGMNCNYQGCNPAAQVLQAELDATLEECAMCSCGAEESEKEVGEPDEGKSPEGQQAE